MSMKRTIPSVLLKRIRRVTVHSPLGISPSTNSPVLPSIWAVLLPLFIWLLPLMVSISP